MKKILSFLCLLSAVVGGVAQTVTTYSAYDTNEDGSITVSDITAVVEQVKNDTVSSGTSQVVRAEDLNSLLDSIKFDLNKMCQSGSTKLPAFIRWNGKKIGALGDSVTAGYNSGKSYLEYLAEELGCAVYNYGLNGSLVHSNSDGTSFVERAREVSDSLDCLLIFGGVNDFLWASPDFMIGDIYSCIGDSLALNTDISTFCGAYNMMLSILMEKLPTKQIYLLTPMHCAAFGDDIVGSWHKNRAGQTLLQFVEAIKAIGQFWGIPVIDLYGESGMNPNIEASRLAYYNHCRKGTTLPDNLHPDVNGHKRIADIIIKNI